MPRGAKPGERRGGRAAGVPNKAKSVKAQATGRAVAEHLEEARRTGRKLAITVLSDYMQVFNGMAARFQPDPPGEARRNPHADEKQFLRYARLAVEVATELASFETPKLRAIQVVAPPPSGSQPEAADRPKRVTFTLKVFSNDVDPDKVIDGESKRVAG